MNVLEQRSTGQHTHFDFAAGADGERPLQEKPEVSDAVLRQRAAALVAVWEITVPTKAQTCLTQRLERLAARLRKVLEQAAKRVSGNQPCPELDLLRSRRLLEQVIAAGREDDKGLEELPHVHIAREGVLPRVVNLAEDYCAAVSGVWSDASLRVYVDEVQAGHPLLMGEVHRLPQALRFAHLEFILDRAEEGFAGDSAALATIPAALHSVVRLNQCEWPEALESLTRFHELLCDDPTGTYPAMDPETRLAYQRQVAHLASHADFNEGETAAAAIELARQAQRTSGAEPDPRCGLRKQHVGYYLLAEGQRELRQRIGYHAPASVRLCDLVRRYNDDFYLIGIIVLTVVLIVPIIAPLVPHHAFWLTMLTLLLALLPVTQGAIDIVNGLVTSLFRAQALPKLDFGNGVPEEATTLVVVPTLLLNEGQVHELFEDLEARFLSNEDPNIHFGLLTDLPDSPVQPPPDESHPLVQMAMRYTENLNAKYAQGRGGRFFLLHRHRVFNHRQGAWMGWERKRGKLLDLNKLLLHVYDSFPIKVGPVHLLDGVRYVITLDSDTMLPHTAARRMIGTMHHPLNRAIVNPKLGIVTTGYGILQPRVGVSVSSASRSRLAAIYSGETGFDIYTRAVSDVYQDLFGEGIFTGKGIYEVSTLNRVLERRFPRNSLLSHDLIEGAYVRAGLVTDVEVIDDYPSQYHAHTRRQHRWIRGDWQILRWLFSPVPDETGKLVPNPISLISKWKILDNLRRSLVEPVTFLILVFGWFFLPGGPLYWTLITIALLLLPATVQLGFDLIRAMLQGNAIALRAAVDTFARSLGVALIHLTFLAHQMMLSIDAIARSINRSFFSGRHLLEWETAAQAESSGPSRGKRTALDIYLQLSPAVAVVLAGGVALRNWHVFSAAGPVLLLWATAPFMAGWLSSSPRRTVSTLRPADRAFLQEQALRIWRFYADFAGPENHWLVPDHVEERDFTQVRLLTPTNIGMLLNGRLAAYELGFITLPEFARAALGSLESYGRLEKFRGHVFNWYDLVTLRAIQPVEVSTVDSGNLAAALYALRAGALDLLRRPLLCGESFAIERMAGGSERSLREWVRQALDGSRDAVVTPAGTPHDRWLGEEVQRRRAAIAALVEDYTPWLLPEFAPLAEVIPRIDGQGHSCEQADAWVRALLDELRRLEANPLAEALRARLPKALERTLQLGRDLKQISDLAEQFVEEMDFGFLFVESRLLLSNGFDMADKKLHKPCFDLLASEARTAAFLAVAKGEIPQQSWFRLDRSHTLFNGSAVLLSWTATMFEHLMPTLWMRSYPDTLLSNSLDTVIRVQMDWVRGMPWGISESGYATTDENGHYFYQAWGIPTIALKYRAEDGPVISPYSTFLALPLKRKAALDNLRRMASLGWVGVYGFYEAADYIQRNARDRDPRLVRTWMAHHQGMSLLALTNVLRANIFQTWFHANPRVRAAEQLLHEKPLSREMVSRLEKEVPPEERAAA